MSGRCYLFTDHHDPGFGFGVFLQKSERSLGFHCGRRNMARECGTCDRPRRQGLKGEGDGSPQHYLGVSRARACAVTAAHGHTVAIVPGAGGRAAYPGHRSAAVACPWQGQGTPRLWRGPILPVRLISEIPPRALNSARGTRSRTKHLRPLISFAQCTCTGVFEARDLIDAGCPSEPPLQRRRAAGRAA